MSRHGPESPFAPRKCVFIFYQRELREQSRPSLVSSKCIESSIQTTSSSESQPDETHHVRRMQERRTGWPRSHRPSRILANAAVVLLRRPKIPKNEVRLQVQLPGRRNRRGILDLRPEKKTGRTSSTAESLKSTKTPKSNTGQRSAAHPGGPSSQSIDPDRPHGRT
jgi:hypothetical protein